MGSPFDVHPVKSMRPIVVLLVVLLSVTLAARDTCEFQDPLMMKLCRKVESNNEYLHTMVEGIHKCETIFRWYRGNKEWLGNQRLGQMMSRLLKRAASAAANAGNSEEELSPSAPARTAKISAPSGLKPLKPELETVLLQVMKQLEETQKRLSQLETQQQQQQQQQQVPAGGKQLLEATPWIAQIESVMKEQQQSIMQAAEGTNKNLQLVVSSSQQMSARLTKAESQIQVLSVNTANGCGCNSSQLIVSPNSDPGSSSGDVQRVKTELQREVTELRQHLRLASGDLEKSMAAIQLHSESALRNFSVMHQESMQSLKTVMETHLAESGRTSYDAIIGATTAFGEDLNLLRGAVSSTTSEVETLKGKEMKALRALEDVRSGVRRHESNIKVLTNEVGDFKSQTQDKLNQLRTHFMQTVNEFYNKIVDRQNQMSSRLTSVVDDVTSVKGKIRNLSGSSQWSESEDSRPEAAL